MPVKFMKALKAAMDGATVVHEKGQLTYGTKGAFHCFNGEYTPISAKEMVEDNWLIYGNIQLNDKRRK